MRFREINSSTTKMKKRKCNYPSCDKDAELFEPFGSMGATDTYCKRHQKKRDKFSVRNKRAN